MSSSYAFDATVYLPAAYSDSDSEWSSLERQKVADVMGKANKKALSHKRIRKKRTAIPVATPKVPSLAGIGTNDGIVGLNYTIKDDKNWRVDSLERGGFCLGWKSVFHGCLMSFLCFVSVQRNPGHVGVQ